MSQPDHFEMPPLSFATITLADVITAFELKAEAKGNDAQLRQESEGGCKIGFRNAGLRSKQA